MSCLTCKHFKPKPPIGWKPEHSYSSKEFNVYRLRNGWQDAGGRFIGATNILAWEGHCHALPSPSVVFAGYECSMYVYLEDGAVADREFIEAGNYYSERSALAKEIAILKNDLKASRKLSASRLDRLRKQKPDPTDP